VKILIVTALALEFKAIEFFLTDTKTDAHPLTGSAYKLGIYQGIGSATEIMIVEAGAGNNRATDETGRAIGHFKPDFVFFVGVAGGVKDVKIGDVVASSKVIGFEVGKATDDFIPRLDTVPASYRLEQLAKEVKREGGWTAKLKVSPSIIPDAWVQPIAAGEKVIASTKSETFQVIKKFCSDAAAVDMEGIGFLIAARPYNIDAIEVRGISDMIDKKEEADATGSQPVAADHAAAFTFAIIDGLLAENAINKKIKSLEFRKELVNKLAELYPQGPEENDIWKRSGGDVAILTNAASRKSQWYSAIEKLSLGGGGKAISLASLINQVKDEFPGMIDDFMNNAS
jgi:adenosylhomocysteine nucleosidase